MVSKAYWNFLHISKVEESINYICTYLSSTNFQSYHLIYFHHTTLIITAFLFVSTHRFHLVLFIVASLGLFTYTLLNFKQFTTLTLYKGVGLEHNLRWSNTSLCQVHWCRRLRCIPVVFYQGGIVWSSGGRSAKSRVSKLLYSAGPRSTLETLG